MVLNAYKWIRGQSGTPFATYSIFMIKGPLVEFDLIHYCGIWSRMGLGVGNFFDRENFAWACKFLGAHVGLFTRTETFPIQMPVVRKKLELRLVLNLVH